MPDDLTVSSVATVQLGNEAMPDPRVVAATAPSAQVGHSPPTVPMTNPSLQLDAALGLVVVEFRNSNGVITTSIPTQRQLEAYRRWDDTRFGPPPPGCNGTPVGAMRQAVPSTSAVSNQNNAKPVKAKQH